MPSKPKTIRREHSAETFSTIIALHQLKKYLGQIADHLKLAKSTVTTILHRHTMSSEIIPLRKKRFGRPSKLDARARRQLIRHVGSFPHDNLLSLATPSKAGQKTTVRRYLKAACYLRFKA